MDITEEALTTGRRRRRHHSVFFKAEAVGACQQPGVSIAWRLPTKLSKHDYLRLSHLFGRNDLLLWGLTRIRVLG